MQYSEQASHTYMSEYSGVVMSQKRFCEIMGVIPLSGTTYRKKVHMQNANYAL